jgi:hypothetical protein
MLPKKKKKREESAAVHTIFNKKCLNIHSVKIVKLVGRWVGGRVGF